MPGNRFLDSVDIQGNELVRGNEVVTGSVSASQGVFTSVTVTSGVSASKFHGTVMDWMTLVRGYKTIPSLSTTLSGGDVYSYTYSSSPSDVVYYRYITSDGSLDAFYTYFAGGVLSGLVATKSITI